MTYELADVLVGPVSGWPAIPNHPNPDEFEACQQTPVGRRASRWYWLVWSERSLRPFICGSCKYFESMYWPSTPEGAAEWDAVCYHPLPVVQTKNFEQAMEGDPCWAFRPDKKYLPFEVTRNKVRLRIGWY